MMWRNGFTFLHSLGFFSNRGIKNPSVSNPSTSSVLFAHCDQAVRRTWWTNLVIPAACFIQTISRCHYVVTIYFYMRLRRWCPFKYIIHFSYNWVKPQLIMNQLISMDSITSSQLVRSRNDIHIQWLRTPCSPKQCSLQFLCDKCGICWGPNILGRIRDVLAALKHKIHIRDLKTGPFPTRSFFFQTTIGVPC